MTARTSERGAAVVDLVLAAVVVVPLVLGVVHLALVWHVRNTVTSAASEGARYAARHDRDMAAGVAYARSSVGGALADRFTRRVRVAPALVGGRPGVRVTIAAEVPPLGLWGPAVEVTGVGRAVVEAPPP